MRRTPLTTTPRRQPTHRCVCTVSRQSVAGGRDEPGSDHGRRRRQPADARQRAGVVRDTRRDARR